MCLENAGNQYVFMERMVELYSRLQDERSRKIFWAQLQFEAAPDMDGAVSLCCVGKDLNAADASEWRKKYHSVAANGKKVILYGAGVCGKLCARLLENSHISFDGFCDRDKKGQTLLGKPILDPEEIVRHPERYTVMISVYSYYDEIMRYLQANHFPMDSIMNLLFFPTEEDALRQYREFPELFKPGTAIVDAGCYNGFDTICFAKWCSGKYSKIYAFEPDAVNYAVCNKAIQKAGLSNVVLIQGGLSDVSGKSGFAAAANGGSCLRGNDSRCRFSCPEAHDTDVDIYALDDVADTEVGMIKMDIEGAEFDALHGARQIIQRDKPQLAICVYHRQGDMLAIMDYLRELVPEYRFWLRHYGVLNDDVVLYAAI